MTISEDAGEKAAGTIYESLNPGFDWANVTPQYRRRLILATRVALTAHEAISVSPDAIRRATLQEAAKCALSSRGYPTEVSKAILALQTTLAPPPEPDALAVIEADVIRRMAKHVSEFYTDYASEDKQEAARDIEAMLLDQAALATYDKAKRPTPAVAADTEALVKEAEAEVWKQRSGEWFSPDRMADIIDRLIASLRKGAGT